MTSIECGWCNTHSHMTEHGEPINVGRSHGGSRNQQVFTCDNCKQANVCTVYKDEDYEARSTKIEYLEGEDGEPLFWEGLPIYREWGPRYHRVKDYPGAPEHITEAANEVSRCLTAGAYRAVGSLARAVLESIAKDRGAPAHGRLQEKIKHLATLNLLRTHVEDAAHGVRHFGNDMAHGDFTEPVTREEAAQIFDLLEIILAEVYHERAVIEAVPAVRTAREKAEIARERGGRTPRQR